MDISKLSYSKGKGTKEEFLSVVAQYPVAPVSNDENLLAEMAENAQFPKTYQKEEGTIPATILFVLSGGVKREKDYLKPLDKIRRVVVAFASKRGQGLLPRQLIETADNFVQKGVFVTPKCDYTIEEGDVIYLLQDVDQFETDIRTIWKEKHTQNVRWIISNPCFEIWLYYHYSEEPPYKILYEIEDKGLCERSQALKHILHNKIKGGISPDKAMEFLQLAIERSRKYYVENEGIPVLYATQMDRLGEDIIKADVSNELEVYWKTEKENREYWKLGLKTMQYINLSGVKVDEFCSSLRNWGEQHPLYLPPLAEGTNGLTIIDNRSFVQNKKIDRTYFDDNKPNVGVNFNDLFLQSINNDVQNYYYAQIILQAPIATYNIYANQILEAIQRMGLENESCSALVTFPVSELPMPMYKMTSYDRLVYIVLDEYLPQFGWKQYEGVNSDFEEIGNGSNIYTNLHKVKSEQDNYGISVMRVGQFKLPPAGNYRMLCLSIIEEVQGGSELCAINKGCAVNLRYEVNDIVIYSNIVSKIEYIFDDGMIKLYHYGEKVSVNQITPIPIDGIHDRNIYYAPVVAASTIFDGHPLPLVETDYSYYMDTFQKEVWQEDGQTTWEKVNACHFRYVHELQHWLRAETSQDGLEIKTEEELKLLHLK